MQSTLFTHVMAGEIATIRRSRFEDESRMQTRCISGSIAGVDRGRHDRGTFAHLLVRHKGVCRHVLTVRAFLFLTR
jgi:hypothetical protein